MSLPTLSPRRYITLLLIVVILTHFCLSLINQGYAHGLSSFKSFLPSPANVSVSEPNKFPEIHPDEPTSGLSVATRANATLLMLCRNTDINEVVASIRQIEDRFNRHYKYPWTLFNEQPFTDDFKRRVSLLSEAPITFGLIPSDHWYQPSSIDEQKASVGRAQLMAQGIIYAGSVPYRNMCRFNSGFFYRHELLQKYRYYWRVEPGIEYSCDMDDKLLFMQENSLIYGFTISLVEWEPTIKSLWATVKQFVAEYPQYVAETNSMDFLSNDGGSTYNLCHYWSNFELGDLDFWRGEAYTKFFDYLEATGNFYYERWGDAPVHSIAVSLFAPRNKVHFFRDIGYKHPPFGRCPSGDHWTRGRCACDSNDSFDYRPNSCLSRYEKLYE